MITKGIFYGIPYTIYFKDDGRRKPVLFFFHGLGSDRNTGAMGRGEMLADIGYYVVAIDAYCHGERKIKIYNDLSPANKQKEVINIAIHTANDALFLYRNFVMNSSEVIPYQVSAYGVSLGATTALYLATIMEELKSVVSILGSPSFVDFYLYKQDKYHFDNDDAFHKNLKSYLLIDPLKNHQTLSTKVIWMAAGSKDEVVPPEFSKKLKELYRDNQNIVYKEYTTAHESTPEMIQDSFLFLSKNISS